MKHDKETRKALEAISNARTVLMLDAPFYGAIALRLSVVPCPDKTDTCATDGHSLFFDPAFINALKPDQLQGLLAHEVMHIAMEHTLRREGRDHRTFNVACDYAINGRLLKAGFKLPSDGCVDPAQLARFDGMAAEQIHAMIPRVQVCVQGDGEGEGQGTPQGGGDSPKDGSQKPHKGPSGGVLDSPDPVGDRTEIQVAVRQAAMCAKMAGNVPGDVERLINDLTRVRVDWRSLLAEFIQRNAVSDYTWAEPNRRYLAAGVYLPRLKSEAMPEIVFAVDTSGSIDEGQLTAAVKSLQHVVADVNPIATHVLACDSRVTWHRTFERGEEPMIEPRGGGGTRFDPVFKRVEKEGWDPCCLIYFTDGIGSFDIPKPNYPVLWLMTGDVTAPWGDSVRVEV